VKRGFFFLLAARGLRERFFKRGRFRGHKKGPNRGWGEYGGINTYRRGRVIKVSSVVKKEVGCGPTIIWGLGGYI